MLLDAEPFEGPVDPQAILACLIVGVLLVVASTHPVELSHTTKVNVSTALEFALPLMVGPDLAIWTLAFSSLALTRWRQSRSGWRWYNVAFNAANLVLSVGVAGLVYQFTANGTRILGSPNSVLAIVLAGATYFVLNVGNVAVMVSLARNSDTVSSYLTAFQTAAPQFVGLLAIGVVTAAVYAASPISTPLLTIPLVAAYFSLKSSLALRSETKNALEALAIQVDQYHPYTAEHSDRVARFSEKIARNLHLADDQVDAIVRAAQIHDLGKLAIWQEMLNKPTVLTEEERAQLQTHPARGAELVSRFSDYRNGRDFILHHHERYDGQGYPYGLKGDGIPLGARIIAVADSTDAMMSDRPYRKALTVDETMLELERNRGKQFDPMVVDVMLSILEKEFLPEGRGSVSASPAAV